MERSIPLVLAAAIVAFAWFAFGSFASVLLAVAKLTIMFFVVAGAGELAVAFVKLPGRRP